MGDGSDIMGAPKRRVGADRGRAPTGQFLKRIFTMIAVLTAPMTATAMINSTIFNAVVDADSQMRELVVMRMTRVMK